jgi:hypothetical protein
VASSVPSWRVEIGVGRLNRFLGTSNLTDKNWCCDHCRTAAQAAEHAAGDRRAAHQAKRQDDEIPHPVPEEIERPG